jgi:hypothetical protein
LVAVGVGIWIFLRKRAETRVSPDDVGVHSGVPAPGREIPPLRPYVRCFCFLASCPAYVLIDTLRIHLTRPHSPPTLTVVRQASGTRPHLPTVITLVPRNYKKSDNFFV